MLSPREKIDERFAALVAADRVPGELVNLFAEFVVTAAEEELFNMSPYRFAEQMGIAVQDVIDLFLYATHAGVLEFHWGVICPSCGAFLSTESGLRWLKSGQYCALCALPFESTVDRDVEVAFTVSPEIRRIRFHHIEELECGHDYMQVMFSSSTTLYPDIHQFFHSAFKQCFHVPANTIESFAFDFAPKHHLLLAPATHAVAHVPIGEAGGSHRVEVELLLDGQLIPQTVPATAPGPGMIRIHNRTNQQIALGVLADDRLAPTPFEERVFPIQPLFEVTPYLTGKQLVTNQIFRELFRTESIPAGSGLEFKNLTFLFTDLKGSTAMYERLGDFRAYALVNSHFALLRGIIAAKGGAIVKTMGDAIMASFCTALAAVEAALLMRQEVRVFGSGEELVLKIGIHEGPALAVAANQRLDYFGQTVNIANRVQNEARPNEIVLTEPVYEEQGVAHLLQHGRLSVTPDEVALRGVSYPVLIYRIV